MLNLDKLPICHLPTLAPSGYQGTIGTAVDYRLRYYFAPYDAHNTVAGYAVRMLDGSLATLGRQFLGHQNNLIAQLKPEGRRLSDDDEAVLNANCVILAYFEQVRRTRGEVYPPLSTLSRRAKLEDLLMLPPQNVVQDISQLSSAFASDAMALFQWQGDPKPHIQGKRRRRWRRWRYCPQQYTYRI